MIIGRGPGSPIGLTVSAEPEWSQIDGTDGTQTRAYASVFKLVADTELIANRLYAALNLIYEPENAKPADSDVWERSSSLGVALGLAYRVTPTLALGVGAEYDRAYDGLALRTLTGEALFVGPTVQINITRKYCWPLRFRPRSRAVQSTIRVPWTSQIFRDTAPI